MCRLHQRFLLLLSLFISESLSFSPAVRRVIVVGGTHGNEYTGVWCIKALNEQQEQYKRKYPTLHIETLLGNPQAWKENKRFIETDLNREFGWEKLCFLDEDDETGVAPDSQEGERSVSIEALRARQLDGIFGSKCDDENPDAFDVAIDLHSTTTNMGITLIINEGDQLMTQGAAYVALKCEGARCLVHSIPERIHRPTLSSAAKHGFTIEVGPVPQGILRHDAVKKTESTLNALLGFFETRNQVGIEALEKELLAAYPNGVPCFRTAPARKSGEISGKIPWPSDPDNPNFPALMVHESLQDQDFSILRTGDPLFVAPDSSVVYYDGSHGEEVYVVFVNEAGYYYKSSGTGIGVAVATQYNPLTGILKDHEGKEEYDTSESYDSQVE